MGDEIKIINRKGGIILAYAGYQYYRHKRYANASVIWNCSEKKNMKCNGSVTVDSNNTLILRKVDHIAECRPDHAKNEVAFAMENAKSKVQTSDEPVTKIYKETFAPIRAKGLDLITKVPSYDSAKHSLYNSRKTAYNVEKTVYKNFLEVEIPKQFREFVIADYYESDIRILVFATNDAKQLLMNIEEIFIDGTFKCVPHPFYQLIVIHGDVGSTTESTKTVPLIYALLPSKKEAIYFIMFDIIKTVFPNWYPRKVHVDFEFGITNAMKMFYPEITINRCYYHFTQCLWRKSKAIGIKSKVCKRIVGLCTALPLLPPKMVTEGWDYITGECVEDVKLTKFIKYFSKYYMKEEFIPEWCIYNQRHRTNNVSESWNAVISKKINKNYTTITKLLSAILLTPADKLTEKRKKDSTLRDENIITAQMQLLINEISIGHFLEKLR